MSETVLGPGAQNDTGFATLAVVHVVYCSCSGTAVARAIILTKASPPPIQVQGLQGKACHQWKLNSQKSSVILLLGYQPAPTPPSCPTEISHTQKHTRIKVLP